MACALLKYTLLRFARNWNKRPASEVRQLPGQQRRHACYGSGRREPCQPSRPYGAAAVLTPARSGHIRIYQQHPPEPIRMASDRLIAIRGHEVCRQNFAHRGRTHDAAHLVASSYVRPLGLAGEDYSSGSRWSNESGNRPSTTGIAQNSFTVATAFRGGPIGGDHKRISSWQAMANG